MRGKTLLVSLALAVLCSLARAEKVMLTSHYEVEGIRERARGFDDCALS